MAEVKTGLEGVLGHADENGTLGKVWYNLIVGSAGTKNVGVGTKSNNGANAVYYGSGMVCCSGVWVHVPQGTKTIGSASAEYVCKNIEVGSDGAVDVTSGGTAADVAGAISARTATKAGHAALAYVTVGTSGSVIGGSIVDERTFLTPTTISYVTGVDYSIDTGMKSVFNRDTFAHYKEGRQTGKLSIKENYVNQGSADVWPTSSTYHTVPTAAFSLAINGVDGTISEELLFQRCAKDSTGLSQPEEDVDTFDISATFGSLTRYA